MKIINNCFGLLSILSILFVSNDIVWAQFENDSLCTRAGESKAVFVGKIAATRERESTSNDYELAPSTLPFAFAVREIDFEVQEAFAGIKEASQITLYSTAKDCDYEFVPGKTYLIYAFGGQQHKFNINSCAAVRPISEADDELTFLRESTRQSSGALVKGKILESTVKTGNKSSPKNTLPISVIEVLLKPISGKGQIRQTKTDSQGKYEIAGVPSGRYILELILPDKIRMVDGTIIGVNTLGLGCITRNIVIENKK